MTGDCPITNRINSEFVCYCFVWEEKECGNMGKQWGKGHWLGLAVTSRPDPVVQTTTALDRATIYSTCQVCEKEGGQVVLLLYKISHLQIYPPSSRGLEILTAPFLELRTQEQCSLTFKFSYHPITGFCRVSALNPVPCILRQLPVTSPRGSGHVLLRSLSHSPSPGASIPHILLFVLL
jgi:hypothetical protein